MDPMEACADRPVRRWLACSTDDGAAVSQIAPGRSETVAIAGDS